MCGKNPSRAAIAEIPRTAPLATTTPLLSPLNLPHSDAQFELHNIIRSA